MNLVCIPEWNSTCGKRPTEFVNTHYLTSFEMEEWWQCVHKSHAHIKMTQADTHKRAHTNKQTNRHRYQKSTIRLYILTELCLPIKINGSIWIMWVTREEAGGSRKELMCRSTIYIVRNVNWAVWSRWTDMIWEERKKHRQRKRKRKREKGLES